MTERTRHHGQPVIVSKRDKIINYQSIFAPPPIIADRSRPRARGRSRDFVRCRGVMLPAPFDSGKEELTVRQTREYAFLLAFRLRCTIKCVFNVPSISEMMPGGVQIAAIVSTLWNMFRATHPSTAPYDNRSLGEVKLQGCRRAIKSLLGLISSGRRFDSFAKLVQSCTVYHWNSKVNENSGIPFCNF